MSDFHIRFWGTRGSIPVPGPNTVRYGGNTSCFEMKKGEDRLVFDAGSGIRAFASSVDLSQKTVLHLFITHPHWDHINGLPLCPVIFIPGNEIHVYGPRTHELSLQDIISGQMSYTYFPVRIAELKATFTYHELSDGDDLDVGPFHISTHKLNHPVECLGYRVTDGSGTIVYLGDNEPYYNIYGDDDPQVLETIAKLNKGLTEFVRDADVLVTDAQYTPEEYRTKVGWGHSSTHHVVNMALKANVRKLYFNHHDPMRTDDDLDAILAHYRKKLRDKGYAMALDATREGEKALSE